MKMVNGHIVSGKFICPLCKEGKRPHCNGFVFPCDCKCAKLYRKKRDSVV